jgi:ATP-dependent RNA helicase DDX51/DBP6
LRLKFPVDHRNLQAKTKAKQRYLKAKRERRKKRLASAPKPKNTNYEQFSERDAEEDNEGDEAQNDEQIVVGEDEMDHETGPLPMDDEEPAESQVPQETPKKEKRPKKRAKKADSQPESSPPPAIEEVPLDAGDVMDVDIPVEPSEPALAAFPLPTAPDPPSKAQLASQGLDPAFLRADIIEPSLTQPVDSVDLSDRMKTRLGELGIESLFAGNDSMQWFECHFLSSISPDFPSPFPP